MIDRSEVNRALAKAIAYKQCGKHASASRWASRLVRLLECAEIIDPYAANTCEPDDQWGAPVAVNERCRAECPAFLCLEGNAPVLGALIVCLGYVTCAPKARRMGGARSGASGEFNCRAKRDPASNNLKTRPFGRDAGVGIWRTSELAN